MTVLKNETLKCSDFFKHTTGSLPVMKTLEGPGNELPDVTSPVQLSEKFLNTSFMYYKCF